MGERRRRLWRTGGGVLLLLATLLAGCRDTPSMPSAPLDRDIVLGVAQTVRVPDAKFELRFDGVSGDSRCPADALCILGGDAIVNITVISLPGPQATYELHTAGPSSARHQSYTLALRQLSPYPFSGRPIDPASYEATIRVSR